MTQEYYSIVTNSGLAKEAAANAPGGSAITLTEMAVGDGNGSSYNPSGSQTSLINEVFRTNLTHVVIDQNNSHQLIVEAVINEEDGPFHIREVGIFDSSGDLFAIGKYPETFKPALGSGSGKRLYIRMILGFANAPQVNLIISDDINNDPNFSSTVNSALDTINDEIDGINDDISAINSSISTINSGLSAANSSISSINTSLSGKLTKSQNLADLTDTTAARQNLGLGSAAVKDTGTTNGKIPLIGSGDKLSSSLLNDTSESTKGIVQLASQTEVDTGTDTGKAVTPATLKSRISSQIRFSNYTSLTINTVYQASYDGFVHGWQNSNGGDFRILTGPDTSTSTIVGYAEFDNYCGPNGACAPIKKGNYYKVTANGGSITAFFVPILNN